MFVVSMYIGLAPTLGADDQEVVDEVEAVTGEAVAEAGAARGRGAALQKVVLQKAALARDQEAADLPTRRSVSLLCKVSKFLTSSSCI